MIEVSWLVNGICQIKTCGLVDEFSFCCNNRVCIGYWYNMNYCKS